LRTLIWSGPALRDIAAVALFYRQIDTSVADKMIERIRAAPLPLLDQPLLGPSIGLRSARKWSVKGQPYVLRYRVAPHRIEILRVHHVAQNWRPE
jgi:toxin ParE1/3/4